MSDRFADYDVFEYANKDSLRILALETSCDETGVAIIAHERDSIGGVILAERVSSQIEHHSAYGGVVPEIAARLHIDCLDVLIKECLDESNLSLSDLDGFAVTSGPGLVGGLLSGIITARALAFACGKPCFTINHLEGHALTPRLFGEVSFPYLLLLLSGAHSHIYIVRDLCDYQLIGATRDDAAGEAFDKAARFLGLAAPGGAEIEKMAARGDKNAIILPRPLIGSSSADFSFSGLKTAFVRKAEQLSPLSDSLIADLAAGFQQSMLDIITDRTKVAIAKCHKEYRQNIKRLVISGGVAANQQIRAAVQQLCSQKQIELFAPPLKWCGDNAAMIAWVAIERLRKQCIMKAEYQPMARWPLENMNTEL